MDVLCLRAAVGGRLQVLTCFSSFHEAFCFFESAVVFLTVGFIFILNRSIHLFLINPHFFFNKPKKNFSLPDFFFFFFIIDKVRHNRTLWVYVYIVILPMSWTDLVKFSVMRCLFRDMVLEKLHREG